MLFTNTNTNFTLHANSLFLKFNKLKGEWWQMPLKKVNIVLWSRALHMLTSHAVCPTRTLVLFSSSSACKVSVLALVPIPELVNGIGIGGSILVETIIGRTLKIIFYLQQQFDADELTLMMRMMTTTWWQWQWLWWRQQQQNFVWCKRRYITLIGSHIPVGSKMPWAYNSLLSHLSSKPLLKLRMRQAHWGFWNYSLFCVPEFNITGFSIFLTCEDPPVSSCDISMHCLADKLLGFFIFLHKTWN